MRCSSLTRHQGRVYEEGRPYKAVFQLYSRPGEPLVKTFFLKISDGQSKLGPVMLSITGLTLALHNCRIARTGPVDLQYVRHTHQRTCPTTCCWRRGILASMRLCHCDILCEGVPGNQSPY